MVDTTIAPDRKIGYQSRSLLLPSALAICVLGLVALFLLQQMEAMDDYYYLRAWDALDTTAFEASLKGNFNRARRDFEEAREKASKLSNPVPYLPIAENQLGENALARDQVSEATSHFSKALATLRKYPTGDNEPDQQMVAGWQLMISLNRLGYIALRRNKIDNAEEYFTQSLAIVRKFEAARYTPEALLPFQLEKMRAVLALVELSLEQGNIAKASESFAEAKVLDADYVYDTAIRKRLRVCAVSLRKAEHNSNTPASPEPSNTNLLTIDAVLPDNADRLETEAYCMIKSESRTGDEDTALINACLKLAEFFSEHRQPSRARRLLVALSNSSAIESPGSALWHTLAAELDRLGARKQTIAMLTRCLKPVHARAAGSVQEGELLLALGQRELANDPVLAERYLSRAYRVYRKNSQLATQSIAAAYKHLHEVAVALAKAQIANGRATEAISTVEEGIKGRPVDDVTFESINTKILALESMKQYEAAIEERRKAIALTGNMPEVRYRQQMFFELTRLYMQKRDLDEAERYCNLGLKTCVQQGYSPAAMLMSARFRTFKAFCDALRGHSDEALATLAGLQNMLLELEAQDIPQRAELPDCLRRVAIFTAEICKLNGDKKGAHEAMTRYEIWHKKFVARTAERNADRPPQNSLKH